MKILIIDDEKAIRRALREILEFEDCNVDEAENGKEGIEKLQKNEYDLIFCDIKMPVMDGIDVLSNAMKLNIETQIIMISDLKECETLMSGEPYVHSASLDLLSQLDDYVDYLQRNK